MRTCPWCNIKTQKTEGCTHMTCSRCEKEWCWSCGCKVEHENALDFHLLNPYGCFFRAGFFDGDIPNLLVSLLVLTGFPVIVYIVITACTVRMLREKGYVAYFDVNYEDENVIVGKM